MSARRDFRPARTCISRFDVGGRPINPLTARLVSRPVFEGPQLAAFKARLKQLTSIPMKPPVSAAAAAAATLPDAG